MKIISYVIFILLVFCNLCFASGVRNIQENYQVVYNILDDTGTFVSGETVALKIKKVSNGHWYDFNDSSFKASGWTSKSTNLSEDATEDYYYYTYDPPASETTAEQYLFMVNNANATYKDHQGELISYQDIGTSDFDYSTEKVTLAAVTHTGAVVPTVTAVTNDVGITQAGADKAWGTAARALTDKSGFSLSAAGIDSIWDELQTDHTSAGTFGKYLDEEVSSAGGDTAAVIADAVWDETLTDHSSAGSTGETMENLDATISSRAKPSDVLIYAGQ